MVGLPAGRVWVRAFAATIVDVTLVVVTTVGAGVSVLGGGVAVITTVITTGARVGAAVGLGAVPQPMMVIDILSAINAPKSFFKNTSNTY